MSLRREAKDGAARLAFVASLTPLLLVGCGKAKKGVDDKKKKEPPSLVRAVEVGEGDTTFYKSADAKVPMFSVRWQKGGFNADKMGVDMGHLEVVSGDLFQNGKGTSTYSAPRGDADRATKRLKLSGGVVLRSADRTQTLRADSAEYRADVRLVRAVGGVTATGPFGTLSGVPELWATPDLRLIGTPDMVSKTLKLSALSALAASAASGSAQLQSRDFRIEGTPSQQLKVVPGGYRYTAVPSKGAPIVVTIPSRGLVIRARGTVVALTDAKGTAITNLTTEGAVNVVQTAPTGTTTLDGRNAVYATPLGSETATLDLSGPVTLVNASKGKDAKGNATSQTTTTKGASGRAILLNRPVGGTALKSVTLTGGVTIDSQGRGDDTFSGRGERLVYTPNGDAASLELTDRVTLTTVSKSADAGNVVTNTVVSRGQRATASLDARSSAANPLRNAVLSGGVSIDVTGSNGQNFKGAGDRVVYTAQGEGGTAVMTGDLKFSGDSPGFDTSGADTATVTIGKTGWETIDLSNSGGTPTSTTIKLPNKSAAPAKGKKGGR